MIQVALLGGGKMGAALLGGLLDAGWAPESLVVAEADAGRRHELEARFPAVRVVPSAAWAVAEAAVVVVAVKPTDVAPVLASASEALPSTALVVSVAAGVTIAEVEAVTGERPVVRAMPNTPALVGAGAAAVAPGRHATDADVDLASRLLGAVGTVEQVPEALLDVVTGLSGSGPAYFFLVAEALVEAGVLGGLPRDVADRLVRQTMLGSGRLLATSDEPAEALRAAVTSPGGTTAAGLHALEAAGVRSAFAAAVLAAARRAAELGDAGHPDGGSRPGPPATDAPNR